MIYIVHGDDFSKTRNAVLNQQKKIGIETRIELDINNVTPEELFSNLHSFDLFANGIFVVLNISKAGRMNLEPYLKVITKIPENVVLVIMSDKSLAATNMFVKNSALLGAKTSVNQKIPYSNTFKFVDAVLYKQRGNAYRELQKLLKDALDPFEIFSTLVWGLRNVVNAKFNNTGFFKGGSFVKDKALSQSKLFSESALKKLYIDLETLDKESKIGLIEHDILVPAAVERVLNS